ncbi:polyketide cyclase [Pseudohoeflea suaedae]|uniref:Polyketide cyclase n=1 Tax=Pseudohoeflea suaedae TaxID=877384 RepID=A0A4R5PPV9_9HYPH|nr:SRPBCC family protein [Pseudohoeflea suaedae]TDH38657.1 polyketide cyclase [Pseudohoeflea suaedae]
MSSERTTLVYVTYIASTAEKVFAAITRPEISRQYWGHENVSDWQVGSDWAHVRDNDEHTVNLVGKVVEIAPPHRLVVSWANNSQKDDPQAYSKVSFEIEDYDDMVRLTVTHDDLVAGSGMHMGVSKGWPIVLSSMKSYLETGRALDIFAKPKAA